jgi:hypothetical protein
MELSFGVIHHIVYKFLDSKKGSTNYDGSEKKRLIQRNENSASMFSINIFPDAICCK